MSTVIENGKEIQTLWVFHDFDEKLCISELVLREDKVFQFLNGELVVTMEKGTVNLGKFFGMSYNANSLARHPDFVNMLKGREVFVIPVSK